MANPDQQNRKSNVECTQPSHPALVATDIGACTGCMACIGIVACSQLPKRRAVARTVVFHCAIKAAAIHMYVYMCYSRHFCNIVRVITNR
jgi:hypothetical protein